MKKVVRSIEPLDEEELEKDIKFVLNSRSDTEELLISELVNVVKYHTNEALSRYQLHIVEDLSRNLKNEILEIIVRSKRSSIVEDDNEW